MTINDKYNILNNTYITKEKEFETEIGDIKQPNFEPQIKIKRWDNEANASFRLIDSSSGVPVVSTEGNKIKWVKDKIEAHFYDLGLGEDRRYEFEIILKEKPATNKLEFSIETKGLDFLYQAELTQQEIDRGISRPENVVGSYAVYHKTQKGNYEALGGKNYKAGKAFHIFRPKIFDADGKWVWGELNVDVQSGVLSVIIPQDFLDTAIYPIKHAAGLTLGYTSVGSSTDTSGTGFIASSKTQASANGVMSKIQAAIWDSGGDSDMKMCVYDDDTDYPSGLLADSYPGAITVTRTTKPTQDSEWTSSINVSGDITSGNYYWLALVRVNASVSWAADAGAPAGSTKYKFGSYYTSFPYDPAPAGASDMSYYYSIYATYTPAPEEVNLKTDLIDVNFVPPAVTIQKSLKYTVLVSNPITKTLQYVITTVSSALTKSLQYTVKPAISITKTLKYTIEIIPSALTKSLKYVVLITPSAITKTLKYVITIVPSAITKSLQYSVAPVNTIQKALKYTIKITPAFLSKSLKYAVLTVITVITKSLKYTIAIVPTAVTKSLEYTVSPSVSVTKSLKYAIKTVPSAITKSLQYVVTIIPSAISKSLQYTVKIVPSAITKSLQYVITTVPSAITKSLQYTVVPEGLITKALKYTVVTTDSLTKSLKYAITIVPSAITKSLEYVVSLSQSVTKSLKYTVKISSSVTKSLQYSVVPVTTTITKSLKYEIIPNILNKGFRMQTRKINLFYKRVTKRLT